MLVILAGLLKLDLSNKRLGLILVNPIEFSGIGVSSDMDIDSTSLLLESSKFIDFNVLFY